MKVAIDANVLYAAGENIMSAVECLCSLRRRGYILVDHQGEIFKEYNRWLEKRQRDPGYELIKKWLHEVLKRTWEADGTIPNPHRDNLRRMKFHRKDEKYVAVSFNSPDHRTWLCVYQDSDYTNEIREYLQQHMAIDVSSPDECLLHWT